MAAPIPGATAAASGGALAYGTAAGRGALLATVLGSGMAGIDLTVVGIALPTIGKHFHAGVSELQWVSNAYTLALSGLLLLGGALGDRYGRRAIFQVGTAWFALASLLCGLAPSAGILVAARGLQGWAQRCSRRGAWPSCRRPLLPLTGPGPSERGPA